MNSMDRIGWDLLRHGGLLLDPPRLRSLEEHVPPPLSSYLEKELRRKVSLVLNDSGDASDFASFVLQDVCGFDHTTGSWQRGAQVGKEWTRRGVAGEAIRPRMLWQGGAGARMPVFLDDERHLGIGRGRRTVSQVLQWLRAGDERLAIVTNGRQWRLIFAGLDFDAWCEWDVDLWFEEGELSPQLTALRTLISWPLWTPSEPAATPPLLQAILDSRKGQAELSAELGERVRAAVEILVDAHGDVLRERCADVDPADIYRAAVRVVMRMVVVLFAESRDLLPRDNALYHSAYGLGGLLEELEKVAARGGNRLARSWGAWPRVLALFRLVHDGSHHPALPVPRYGGELFGAGDPGSQDGLSRAVSVFETACFEGERMSDREVHRVLERITRTRIRVRQGRGSTWVPAPVDFSDLSSEYIGILYEGLLDFELKTAPAGDPVIFLAVGNQPALPLSRLEAMDDGAIANLLEKLKDTSKASDGEEQEDMDESEETEDEEAQASADEDEDAVDDEEDTDADESGHDARHTTRTRAEQWARRAVDVGNLVSKPRGRLTPERRLAHEEAVGRKARQLVARVVLPGEWYLVRWGGTRKGSGTFYTRPGLAVPTVHRTLRPLAFDPPAGPDGDPDLTAPASEWVPKPPEAILALKVCDPACGSGTFPVAALRFLTEALYAALHHHGRVGQEGDRAVVRLLEGTSPAGPVPEERLGHDLLPESPDSERFESRLKAVLRRYVVERCIYGVDLDPLAVELCRLALWIETMDRSLPFSFVDHKVKVGNSLVGAWFDTFQHYPPMAWKNREGGDKNHNNGVHVAPNERGKAIKEFVRDRLTPSLQQLTGGRSLDLFSTPAADPVSAHRHALATVTRIHELSVHESAERARLYREDLLASSDYRTVKQAMDLWCACWFWPPDRLDDAPLPESLVEPEEGTRRLTDGVAASKRFFHWELEFPDVFNSERSGFDAILGNPPWDIAKPSSKEFFSNIDPLYRSYGKQEALRWQSQYFQDADVESRWLDYSADFRAQSNYVSYAAEPFGDPDLNEKSQDRLSIYRGKENERRHAEWRKARSRSHGFADPKHPYRHQGSADLNLFKLFLEQAYSLMRPGGRLGFIVPSGLYSDHGTGALRHLFLDQCRWEWLFGFENREGIFAIHRSFKFNPIVVEKGGRTDAIRTAFMRRRLEDWERAEGIATPYRREQVDEFSPRERALLEHTSPQDLSIVARIFGQALPASHVDLDDRCLEFSKGDFDMVAGSKYFVARTPGEPATGIGTFRYSAERQLLPLYEGRMIGHFDASKKGWVRGRGRGAKWRQIMPAELVIEPQWLVDSEIYVKEGRGLNSPRVGFIRVTSSTNTRTVYAAVLPPYPTGFTACQLQPQNRTWEGVLELATVLNSYVFDFVARRRVCGLDIAWFHVQELPLPTSDLLRLPVVLSAAAALNLSQPVFAPVLLHLRNIGIIGESFRPAVSQRERLGLRCALDAVVATAYGVSREEMRTILCNCDHPAGWKPPKNMEVEEAKGFWRESADLTPELRPAVLTQVAFDYLQGIIGKTGDTRVAVEHFMASKQFKWSVPSELKLADYGLGSDARAETSQPVGERLEDESQDEAPWPSVFDYWLWVVNMAEQCIEHGVYRDAEYLRNAVARFSKKEQMYRGT
jgi:hypothetical protein